MAEPQKPSTLSGLTEAQSADVLNQGKPAELEIPREGWTPPMKKPTAGFESPLEKFSFKPRPVVESEHILQGGDDTDEISSRTTVAHFLNSKYGEDFDTITRDYERVVKDFGLSGNPLSDVKAIRAGDLKVQEKASTVIARGLDRMGYQERHPEKNLWRDIKNSFDRGFLAEGAGAAAQGLMTGIEAQGDLDIEGQLLEEMGLTVYDDDLGDPLKSSDVMDWREEVRARNVVDPAFSESITGQTIQGFGQAGFTIPAFMVNAPLASGLSVAQAYQFGEDRYRDFAKSKGITFEKEEAMKAGLWNMPSAALDIIADRFVVGKVLKPLKGKNLTKGRFTDIVLDTVEAGQVGALTEGSQTFWENFNAKYLSAYDRDAKLGDDVIDSMIVGGIVDSTISGGGQTVTAASKRALDKWFAPVEGMAETDMAAARSTVSDEDFQKWNEETHGDQTTDDGTPLQDLATRARNGDAKAASDLVAATTVEASQSSVEAGLSAEEAEVRGVQPEQAVNAEEEAMNRRAISDKIKALKQGISALEGKIEERSKADGVDVEGGAVNLIQNQDIERLARRKNELADLESAEAKQVEDPDARPDDVMAQQAREEARAEREGSLIKQAEEEIAKDEAEEVADMIEHFDTRSRGGVKTKHMPKTRKGGAALIDQMRRSGMSKEEIAAESLRI